MILKIAWRNIWRSPVRSWVVIGSLTIGMFAGVFTSTFMNGWFKQRIRDGVETETSHIKVQTEKFRKTSDFEFHFPDAISLADSIKKIQGVDGTSPRLSISSMIASAETATGVKILGVDPQKEKTVVNIHEKLLEGQWFQGIKRHPVVIGEKLAGKLKVRLRSKLIITLQDAEGNITGGSFRVAGIFKTVNTTFDETNVWVRYTDLLQLTGLPDGTAHEIAVHVENPNELLGKTTAIKKTAHELNVANWREFSPEFGYLDEMGKMYNYIFVVIILLALGFGIVNTMLMVVMERVRELGMLMAVGMNKKRVFTMIMLETIMLCITGGGLGILLGIAATEISAETGIDLSLWNQGLSEWGFASIIYPEYDLPLVIGIALLVIITGVIAAIYPAYKALKLNPSEAVRVI